MFSTLVLPPEEAQVADIALVVSSLSAPMGIRASKAALSLAPTCFCFLCTRPGLFVSCFQLRSSLWLLLFLQQMSQLCNEFKLRMLLGPSTSRAK